MYGVMNVPQARLVWAIRRTARRPPPFSVSRLSPSEPTGRPLPPAWLELNHPKKTPPPPPVAVKAKVPEAVSLSLSVFGLTFAATYAGRDARVMLPPISPLALPAWLVVAL